MFVGSEIVAAAVGAIAARNGRLCAEQAVRGVDSLDEVGLHPVLAGGLVEAGFGVEREVVYPGEHASAVRKSARARCDLVLMSRAGLVLEDPAAEQAAIAAGEGTLFGGVADRIEGGPGDGARVRAGDAYWLEIKSVAQHDAAGGTAGYESRLVRGVMGDVIKLAKDPSIWSGGAMLVLFCGSRAIADHDLAAVAHRLLDEDVPVGAPEIGGCAIEDRVGNAWCGVGLYPLRAGG